jgi:hypothetical protein
MASRHVRGYPLRPDPLLGEGHQDRLLDQQCSRRRGRYQAGVPRGLPVAALSRAARQLLRVKKTATGKQPYAITEGGPGMNRPKPAPRGAISRRNGMARRIPLRKVIWFELVPPRLAAIPASTLRFEVGRRSGARYGSIAASSIPARVIRPEPGEWHPSTPERLDEEELVDWRAGGTRLSPRRPNRRRVPRRRRRIDQHVARKLFRRAAEGSRARNPRARAKP